MLKKLTALSLSLLICLSLIPGQAGAMDAPENEPPVQAEDVENPVSPEDADAGIAPCQAVGYDILGPGENGSGGGHRSSGSVSDARWPGTNGSNYLWS